MKYLALLAVIFLLGRPIVAEAQQCFSPSALMTSMRADAKIYDTLSQGEARRFLINLGVTESNAAKVDLVIIFHVPEDPELEPLVVLFSQGCFMTDGLIPMDMVQKALRAS
jgi:hypothetical protein